MVTTPHRFSQLTAPLVVSFLVSFHSPPSCLSFAPPMSNHHRNHHPAFSRNGNSIPTFEERRSSSALCAIGVLARKAKEMEIRKYVEGGVEDSVMAKMDEMKSNLDTTVDNDNDNKGGVVGPLQEALTKRKGTISIIAEYKRKMETSGYIDEVFDPDVLSSTFREFGASAIAVMADERMGGCTYDDIGTFVKEQQTAKGDMPGPLPVINSDLVVDEIQMARSAAYGATAVVLTPSVVGMDKLGYFLKVARALQLEAIVNVGSKDEAQQAIDCGATLLAVSVGQETPDVKADIVANLTVPENTSICTIATIPAKDDKELGEVEEAWMLRDKGFNAVWASDVLYKFGADAVEHPGAIINSMKSKSSVKWASPTAKSGKGEGSREYLGDILM